MTGGVESAIAAAVVAAMAGPLRELQQQIVDQVDARIRAATTARIIAQAEVAALVGKSPKALSMFLSRPSGASLLALAKVDQRGVRRWVEADVRGWLEAGR